VVLATRRGKSCATLQQSRHPEIIGIFVCPHTSGPSQPGNFPPALPKTSHGSLISGPG
jgi:hypothetical protein